MRKTGLIAPLIALAAVASPLAAQPSNEEWMRNCEREQTRNGRVVHCEVRESRIPARGPVRVETENSPVAVRAWEGTDVLVRARIQTRAATEAEARELARQVRIDTEGAIGATGPRTNGNRNWSVAYEIMVPARSDLDLRTENGPVSVERVSGTIQVRAENGPLDLRELGGTVNARAENGPVTITLAGRRWNGSGLDVETVNGPVTVRMPQGYAARLEASTVNGPISAPGTIQRPEGGRRWTPGGRVSTDLNGGGPTIRVATTNGPLSVREM